jgi:chromosome segregation ATPase
MGDGNIPRQIGDLGTRIADLRDKIAAALNAAKEGDRKVKESIEEQLRRIDSRSDRADEQFSSHQRDFTSLLVAHGKTEAVSTELQAAVNALTVASTESRSTRDALVKSVGEIERDLKSLKEWRSRVDESVKVTTDIDRMLNPPPEVLEESYIDIKRGFVRMSERIADAQKFLGWILGSGGVAMAAVFGFTRVDSDKVLQAQEAQIAASRAEIVEIRRDLAVSKSRSEQLEKDVERLRKN